MNVSHKDRGVKTVYWHRELEVARLGGDFAHVHDEVIVPKHDDAAGEAWLHGRFSYMLYRRPQASCSM